MATSFSFHAFFLVLCIFCSLSLASSEPFDVATNCPKILTTASLKNEVQDNAKRRILVPWRMGFDEFVNFKQDSCMVDGFSVQVFLHALRYMPNPPNYTFVVHGDGKHTPSYDEMVDMVFNQTVDAVVADLTVTKERMKKVGFSMSYLPSSLVMVTPFKFTSLCVFESQRDSVQTHLGRIVTVFWLFVVLIFNSSYTASLASLLSAQKRNPTIKSFQALSKDNNIKVGCLEGSFVERYMENLEMERHRLKKFTSGIDYARALREGNLKPDGVGAVLDELPYIQIFLQSECGFTVSSNDSLPSYGGFAFAFRKGDPLIDQISEPIVAMEEDGTL